MAKTIKIIELLDNYADEKEIVMPQYVRYLDRNVNEKAIMLVCQENIIDKLDKKIIKLNDEVEILEDNIEEIEENCFEQLGYDVGKMTLEIAKGLEKAIKEMRNKKGE